jgi:hypothetical protein
MNNDLQVSDIESETTESESPAPSPLPSPGRPKRFCAEVSVHEHENTAEGQKFTISGTLKEAGGNNESQSDPVWKDHAVMAGAVRCEFYLSPLEYAIFQMLKEKHLTYYNTDRAKQGPAITESAGINPPSEESLELARDLFAALLEKPEKLEGYIAFARKRNESAIERVKQKWPHLEAAARKPDTLDSHPLVIAVAKIQQDFAARKTTLAEQFSAQVVENDRLTRTLKETAEERDHFMRLIDEGPDFLNHRGTIDYLRDELVRVSRKLEETMATRH